MVTLVEKILRRWGTIPQEEPQIVTNKAQVTAALYHQRCPVEMARPFSRRDLPPRRFRAAMDEPDLRAVMDTAGIAPRSVLEIGSFWGDTAILIAKTYDIPVVCIDTWLGGLGVWDAPPPNGFLYRGDEIPPARKFFREFASNVERSGTINKITSVRLPSPTALRLLHSKGLKFDAIYVDGSHDYIDVYIDIALSRAISAPGGLVFGDDFQIPNVQDAVRDFCSENGLTFKTLASKTVTERQHKLYWMIEAD